MFSKIVEKAADKIEDIKDQIKDQIKEDLNLHKKKEGENGHVNGKDGGKGAEEKKNSDKPIPRTNSDTPIQFLKKLRSASILSNSSSGTIDNESMESSITDSIKLNNANKPNKITGEMGVEIYPSPDGKDEVILQYVQDRHFQYIHPHVFAPACLTDVQRMGGGGSGVSVFCGTHPTLGEIVMKHGGASDMKELFALETIAQQLRKRGHYADDAKDAADAMKKCLPEFKMVYISPQHVLYKPKAVWGKLKKLVKIGRDKTSRESFASLAMKIEMSERVLQIRRSTVGPQRRSLPKLITLDDSKFLGPGVCIRVYECDSGNPVCYIEDSKLTKKPSLNFVLPKDHIRSVENKAALALECTEEFDSLDYLYENLSPLMSKHLFKFTLAQKRIGGHNAKTGSQWLYEGEMDGLVLGNLIAQFIETVRNLQALTLPEEVDVVDQIRAEVEEFQKSPEAKADDISPMADQYMGNCIKKNFHPNKGRIRFLKKTCNGFHDGTYYLEEEEIEPAGYLAKLGQPGVLMSDIFEDASSEPPLFHPNKDLWLNLMAFATDRGPHRSPNATKRVWTSGLCDAGIHNLFVSKDDLYFFDLGVPQLQSLPGFMTKFLFSFFHILGMEEDPNSNDGEWVRRFVPENGKLVLTQETKDLLPKAYDAFEVSLTRIIEEVFDGDQSLRWLLLQYVTLQLLSDASFCLQRWSIKGGGQPRTEDNHHEGLERWLWRALWDCYVAFDINTLESWDRLDVEMPDLCDYVEEDLRATLVRKSDEWNAIELPCLHETSEIRRNSLRWSSERLNSSSLRELTAAAFEYHGPIEELEGEDSETETCSETDTEFTPMRKSSSMRSSLESLEEKNEVHE